jgi:hypothetical protein
LAGALSPVRSEMIASSVGLGGAPGRLLGGVVQGAVGVNLVAEAEGEHARAFVLKIIYFYLLLGFIFGF